MKTDKKVDEENDVSVQVGHNGTFDYNHMLTLMSIYRDEWKYRDSDCVSVTFRYAFISLGITFLPNFATEFKFSQIPLFQQIPPWAFSIAGIVCSLVSLYVVLASAKRVEFIDDAYKKIMHDLPEVYKIKSINEDPKIRNRIYRLRLNAPLAIIVFAIVITLAIANIFWAMSL